MAAPEEGTGIHNKNVLFLWKYQVSLNLVFELKGQEVFVFLCGSLRQEGGWEEEGGGDSERVKP